MCLRIIVVTAFFTTASTPASAVIRKCLSHNHLLIFVIANESVDAFVGIFTVPVVVILILAKPFFSIHIAFQVAIVRACAMYENAYRCNGTISGVAWVFRLIYLDYFHAITPIQKAVKPPVFYSVSSNSSSSTIGALALALSTKPSAIT